MESVNKFVECLEDAEYFYNNIKNPYCFVVHKDQTLKPQLQKLIFSNKFYTFLGFRTSRRGNNFFAEHCSHITQEAISYLFYHLLLVREYIHAFAVENKDDFRVLRAAANREDLTGPKRTQSENRFPLQIQHSPFPNFGSNGSLGSSGGQTLQQNHPLWATLSKETKKAGGSHSRRTKEGNEAIGTKTSPKEGNKAIGTTAITASPKEGNKAIGTTAQTSPNFGNKAIGTTAQTSPIKGNEAIGTTASPKEGNKAIGTTASRPILGSLSSRLAGKSESESEEEEEEEEESEEEKHYLSEEEKHFIHSTAQLISNKGIEVDIVEQTITEKLPDKKALALDYLYNFCLENIFANANFANKSKSESESESEEEKHYLSEEEKHFIHSTAQLISNKRIGVDIVEQIITKKLPDKKALALDYLYDSCLENIFANANLRIANKSAYA
jgi:hypothetical protein